MKDTRSMHLKVQEHADCFATTDPLKEMSKIAGDNDLTEASAKWLALAALHGVNAGAKSITIEATPQGTKVTALYREATLPTPGKDIGQKVVGLVRKIGGLEGPADKIPLALGIRDSSLEITLEAESTKDGEKVTLHFP